MELISLYELVLVVAQVGYSLLVKKYASINPQWLPAINFALAAVTWTTTTLHAGQPFSVAIVQGLYKGFLTMLAVTGAYSSSKNTAQAIAKRLAARSGPAK